MCLITRPDYHTNRRLTDPLRTDLSIVLHIWVISSVAKKILYAPYSTGPNLAQFSLWCQNLQWKHIRDSNNRSTSITSIEVRVAWPTENIHWELCSSRISSAAVDVFVMTGRLHRHTLTLIGSNIVPVYNKNLQANFRSRVSKVIYRCYRVLSYSGIVDGIFSHREYTKTNLF